MPSLIGEHLKQCCEGNSKGNSKHREGQQQAQGNMLYLETNHKDLYRVQEGAYALRVEPKPAATGETRMGLVLIKVKR